METNQFKILYRLTLEDDSLIETSTYVAASTKEVATSKLYLWRKTQKPSFVKIEYFDIVQVNNVIV
jgi:hypothetical protein